MAPAGSLQNGAPDLGPAIQFNKIPATKLFPLLWVVAEPAAQGIAGGHLLEPAIQLQSFSLHPPRPKAVHQKVGPIVRRRWFVDTLDLDRHALLLLLSTNTNELSIVTSGLQPGGGESAVSEATAS